MPNLPNDLAALTLSSVIKGSRANKMIHRMHGKSTGERGNSSIGYYRPESRKNVLYLTAFENQQQAERSLTKMIAKMADTTFGFTPPAMDTIGLDTIYRSQGMGLSHFFFRRDNFVLWWQVVPHHAETTLAALLDIKF